MNDGMTYSLLGQKMTESFEQLRLKAYQDGAGIWTVGYGHTGKGVHQGLVITEYTATQLLNADLAVSCHVVKSYVKVALNQNQFDALVDFAFNEGAGHLAESTLLKRVNEGRHTEAAKEFGRWVYAGGEIEEGLVTRRAAESELYLAPVNDPVVTGQTATV